MPLSARRSHTRDHSVAYAHPLTRTHAQPGLLMTRRIEESNSDDGREGGVEGARLRAISIVTCWAGGLRRDESQREYTIPMFAQPRPFMLPIIIERADVTVLRAHGKLACSVSQPATEPRDASTLARSRRLSTRFLRISVGCERR